MRTSAIAVIFVAVLTPLSVEVAEAAGQTHPLTVTGRALDPQGKTIKGATIFIVSTYGNEKALGKATSDAQGRYSFQDLPLPILVQKRVEIEGTGHFQIFGRAPGRAWAWCKAQQLCLDLSKKAERTPERRMFFPDDAVQFKE